MNIYEINDAWNNKWDDKEIKKKDILKESHQKNDDKQENILDIGFLNIIKIYFNEYFNIILPLIISLFIIIIIKLKY